MALWMELKLMFGRLGLGDGYAGSVGGREGDGLGYGVLLSWCNYSWYVCHLCIHPSVHAGMKSSSVRR